MMTLTKVMIVFDVGDDDFDVGDNDFDVGSTLRLRLLMSLNSLLRSDANLCGIFSSSDSSF